MHFFKDQSSVILDGHFEETRLALSQMIERTDIVTDEHLSFLDDLRLWGATSIGAAQYIEDMFDLSQVDARQIFIYWIETFLDRH